MIERKQFSGAKGEDPNLHIADFCQYCNTIRQAGVTQDQIREILFPFSLCGKAKLWFNGLNRTALGITDWETLALNFYNKYYPAERTAVLRSAIQNFAQEADETLYEARERFKDLQRECPHHNLAQWQLIQAFYNGLGNSSRSVLDSAASGRFMNLNVDDAGQVIEDMAIHNSQYGNPRGFANKGKHNVDSVSFLQAQLTSICQKLDNLTAAPNSVANVSAVANHEAFCENCGIVGHWEQDCRSSMEQVNAFQTYRQNNPYSNSYNAGYWNHPYLSYRSTNVQNPPPPQQPQQQPPPQQKYYHPNAGQKSQVSPSSSSDPAMTEIRAMLVNMQKHMESRDAQIDSILAHNKIMDNQIAQLSSTLQSRQQGALPSQPIHPTDHANAITLRSGSHYDGPPMPKEDRPVPDLDSSIPNGNPASPAGLQIDTNPTNVSVQGKSQDKGGDVQSPVIKLPFPNRQLKSKLDKQFGKFLEVVKNLQVTVPFTDLITQVPAYAKFMKDILTRKRAFNEVETVAFTEECSAYLQNKSPPKLKDPGSFSIPCHIGNVFIDKALCDLGASVSVMPSSVCAKLNMGELKVTNITLQMADRSVKYPLGILEDVPVRVGKFFIPVDFVVLDMAEDTQIPIILGRPFLHTAGAIIDVKNGKLTLSVGDDNVTFNLGKVLKGPML